MNFIQSIVKYLIWRIILALLGSSTAAYYLIRLEGILISNILVVIFLIGLLIFLTIYLSLTCCKQYLAINSSALPRLKLKRHPNGYAVDKYGRVYCAETLHGDRPPQLPLITNPVTDEQGYGCSQCDLFWVK